MGKIGVLIVGAKGAVATTLMAAQCAVRKRLDFGFPLPSQAEPLYRTLPLVDIQDVVFGGWDIVSDSYAESCLLHGVVPPAVVEQTRDLLDQNPIYPAILVEHEKVIEDLISTDSAPRRMRDVEFSTTIFTARPHADLVTSLQYDIEDFRSRAGVERVIVVNLASTERTPQLTEIHEKLDAFEKGLEDDSPHIASGMLYAYAAISAGCHFINFAPSITADIPALLELARRQNVAVAGKDGKTGQTLYKTALAPMLRDRGLRVTGWYSANILGNRDGFVLRDPDHKASKIASKSEALPSILGYSDFDHQVHIHYYRPRGDAKEAWDNVDFRGWFDTPMQLKVNWLGDDSILAAPLVLDLIRWVHFFAARGESGVLSQLASYFKSPLGCDEHDFARQLSLLRDHVARNYAAGSGTPAGPASGRAPERRA